MLKRADLADLRERLNRPADTMPVRAMALICFAAAGLLLFGLATNTENLPVSSERRLFNVGVTALAGAAYWIFAKHFRVWMLHLIITAGLAWGLLGLSQMNTAIGSAMTILSIIWTCLLIGSISRPPVARAYGAFVFIGIAIALARSPINIPENTVMAISYGLTIIVTMELLSQTSTRLRDDASHDPLTGLLNRKGLEQALSKTIRVAQRRDEPVAIVSFDLNDFKAVNDRHGHEAGDRLLVRCAELWSENIRAQDVLARFGGDEFLLLLPDTSAAEVAATMQRLGESSPASFAYGVAVIEPGDSFELRLREADAELIQAKAATHGSIPEPSAN